MTATLRSLIEHGLRCHLPAPLLRLSWRGRSRGVVPRLRKSRTSYGYTNTPITGEKMTTDFTTTTTTTTNNKEIHMSTRNPELTATGMTVNDGCPNCGAWKIWDLYRTPEGELVAKCHKCGFLWSDFPRDPDAGGDPR